MKDAGKRSRDCRSVSNDVYLEVAEGKCAYVELRNSDLVRMGEIFRDAHIAKESRHLYLLHLLRPQFMRRQESPNGRDVAVPGSTRIDSVFLFLSAGCQPIGNNEVCGGKGSSGKHPNKVQLAHGILDTSHVNMSQLIQH